MDFQYLNSVDNKVDRVLKGVFSYLFAFMVCNIDGQHSSQESSNNITQRRRFPGRFSFNQMRTYVGDLFYLTIELTCALIRIQNACMVENPNAHGSSLVRPSPVCPQPVRQMPTIHNRQWNADLLAMYVDCGFCNDRYCVK